MNVIEGIYTGTLSCSLAMDLTQALNDFARTRQLGDGITFVTNPRTEAGNDWVIRGLVEQMPEAAALKLLLLEVRAFAYGYTVCWEQDER